MILTGPVGRYQNYLSILKKCEQSFFSKTKEILICTKKGNISSVAAFQSQPRNFFIFYFHRPFKVNLIGGSLLLQ